MHGKPIGIDQNPVSGFDLFFRRPFRVQMHLHIHQIRHPSPEALRQQLDTRVVFMRARAVTRLSANKYDILFLICVRGKQGQRC